MKIKVIIILGLLITSYACKDGGTKKEIYYKAPNGKIFTAKQYAEIKNNLSKRGTVNETIISTTEKKDSIIKLFKTEVLPNFDPYSNAKTYIGKKLPFKNLIGLDGKNINLETLKGKPILINFWFTTCKPCIAEMPALNKIKEEYNNSVIFLAITFENKEKVENFLKNREFKYFHIPNSKKEIDKIGNESYPLNIFLDKNGIVKYVRGSLSENGEEFKVLINKLL